MNIDLFPAMTAGAERIESVLSGAAFKQALTDIRIMSRRVSVAKKAAHVVGWREGDREIRADLIDGALSVASTASRCVFFCDGEKWKLEIVDRDSEGGADLVSELHRLRVRLIEKKRTTAASLRCSDAHLTLQALMPKISRPDAASRHHITEFALLVEFGRTGDAQGGAQPRAKELPRDA